MITTQMDKLYIYIFIYIYIYIYTHYICVCVCVCVYICVPFFYILKSNIKFDQGALRFCMNFGHLMRRIDSLKRPWCWEGLGAGGEGDNRGWDVWMASLTRWTWVWVNSGSWWWTGRPGVLRFMGSQRVGHDWATELNWIRLAMNVTCTIDRNVFPFNSN